MRNGDGQPDRLVWRKSSYSGGNGECVEISEDRVGLVWVRDSKNLAGPWLSFPDTAWRDFVRAVQHDQAMKS